MPGKYLYKGILCEECKEKEARKRGFCCKCYGRIEAARRKWCPGFFHRQAEKNSRPINRAYRRGYELQKVFGISPEQFEEMLIKQHRVCFVCSKPREGRALCVDHCHKSGKIRGLLCHKCNSAVGQLNDSPELAMVLSSYLQYWQSATNPIAPNLVMGPLRNRSGKPESVKVEEVDLSVFKDFEPELGSPDLRQLSILVQTAGKLETAIKTNLGEKERLQRELREIIEDVIPAKMLACGVQEFTTSNGMKIELKNLVYANIPSQSSIDSERDDERRDELIARRKRGLEIVEEKAPSLIKRKFEISFERDAEEEAKAFEEKLQAMENAPEFTQAKSVHPQTLSKWIKEYKSDGSAFTDEEQWALGIYPKKVAKISK